MIFFTKYTEAGASSRYRTYQYLPGLRKAGMTPKVLPLFNDTYLARKYASGSTPRWLAAAAMLQRLWQVLTVPRDQRILIEYELFPFLPAWFEYWLSWRGCEMVVDYDDALFHQYDTHRHPWVRRLLGGKIATVMRLAHTVVVGNEYLANYAKAAGARRIEVLPTVIDLARYPAPNLQHSGGDLVIGWIGSPTTAPYLQLVAPALAEVCRAGGARVRLVGAGAVELAGVPLELVPWAEATEVASIQRFDVGIMPLPDEPWARGKCGFKLIQYMACGVPVVASPVGVNQVLVVPGVQGYLAQTTAEWVQALHALLESAELRQQLGAAGRAQVEQAYCLQATAPKLAKILQAAC